MTTRTPISESERQTLLRVAADVIGDALTNREPRLPEPGAFTTGLAAPRASFVTLERGESLLGCIGSLIPTEALIVDVARHALAAAFADPRLPPVTRLDYEDMTIKVSVLSTAEPLDATTLTDVSALVRPGIDGLVIESHGHRGTLLPSVWRDVRTVDAFLAVLWHKAGLTAGAWPTGTVVSRYTTEEFGDAGPRSLAVATP